MVAGAIDALAATSIILGERQICAAKGAERPKVMVGTSDAMPSFALLEQGQAHQVR